MSLPPELIQMIPSIVGALILYALQYFLKIKLPGIPSNGVEDLEVATFVAWCAKAKSGEIQIDDADKKALAVARAAIDELLK